MWRRRVERRRLLPVVCGRSLPSPCLGGRGTLSLNCRTDLRCEDAVADRGSRKPWPWMDGIGMEDGDDDEGEDTAVGRGDDDDVRRTTWDVSAGEGRMIG